MKSSRKEPNNCHTQVTKGTALLALTRGQLFQASTTQGDLRQFPTKQVFPLPEQVHQLLIGCLKNPGTVETSIQDFDYAFLVGIRVIDLPLETLILSGLFFGT